MAPGSDFSQAKPTSRTSDTNHLALEVPTNQTSSTSELSLATSSDVTYYDPYISNSLGFIDPEILGQLSTTTNDPTASLWWDGQGRSLTTPTNDARNTHTGMSQIQSNREPGSGSSRQLGLYPGTGNTIDLSIWEQSAPVIRGVSLRDAFGHFQEATSQHNEGFSRTVIHPQTLRSLGWEPESFPPGEAVLNLTPDGPRYFSRFIKVTLSLGGPAFLLHTLVFSDDLPYDGMDIVFGSHFNKRNNSNQPLVANPETESFSSQGPISLSNADGLWARGSAWPQNEIPRFTFNYGLGEPFTNLDNQGLSFPMTQVDEVTSTSPTVFGLNPRVSQQCIARLDAPTGAGTMAAPITGSPTGLDDTENHTFMDFE